MNKSELKYYSSLLNKKFRTGEKKIIIEGKRIIEEALKSSFQCEAIFCCEDYLTSEKGTSAFLKMQKIRTETIPRRDFLRLCDTENPQGIAGVFRIPENEGTNFGSSKLICALENISDPGNLGTIIRNCDWFGITEILISSQSADVYNSKCIRSTMGSLFHVSLLQTADFFPMLKSLQDKDYKIANSDMNGENVFSFRVPDKAVVVFSNEAGGPSDELNHISDSVITIPRIGNAESLNVANASAIILSQLTNNNF